MKNNYLRKKIYYVNFKTRNYLNLSLLAVLGKMVRATVKSKETIPEWLYSFKY